jgi:GH3 auxin-responsive promoter
VRFERSGGSSGAHKLVPFTQSFLDDMQRALGPWLFDLTARHAGVARGCAYWSISPLGDRTRTTSGGTPIGADDDASYFPRPVRALLSRVLAAPAALAHIGDVDACRYATLRVLLEREDLSLISVWSPTFLSLMLDALARDRERLARDLTDGVCSLDSAAVRALPFSKRPDRARLLLNTTSVRALWPQLALVSMWTDGASAAFAAEVGRRLDGVAVQGKGLLATEGVVSVPYRGARPLAVLSHVIELEDEDAPGARPRFVHEAEIGRRYQVLLTTSAGLVRYRLGDRVEVTGALEATPTIRFLGRAGHVSDLVGEKLAADFVARALASAAAHARFAMLAPAHDARGYLLFLETSLEHGGRDASAVARDVDTALCASHPYDYARKLGQLAPVRAVMVRDGARRYERACIARGQRAGDIKLTPLHLARDWEEALTRTDA